MPQAISLQNANFFSSLKVLTHAANTPVTNLLINLDLLTKDPHLQLLSSNSHYYLQKAIISSKYLKEIMSQSSEDSPNIARLFNVKEAIAQVVQVCKKPTAKVQLIKYLQLSNDHQLNGNKLYFQETLICLLNNAFNAYKNNQSNQLVVLTASVVGNKLELRIVDSAKGFLQLNDSCTQHKALSIKEIPITGTGLEFAQKVIEGHFKGKIVISTKLQKGTTVYCSLPLSSSK